MYYQSINIYFKDVQMSLQNIVGRIIIMMAAPIGLMMSSCTTDEASLTVYSGRSENLIGPILESYELASGVKVDVKYGKTSEITALLLEEGDKTPADIFIAQDAGALGAIQEAGMLAPIPEDILRLVGSEFRSTTGEWTGISGRARTIVYNTAAVSPDQLPSSILDFTKPEWRGRIGWAPTNGSFQAFVTAIRIHHGEEIARDWLTGIMANDPKVYPKNTPIVAAAAAGEIDVGFVNHYYLHRFLAEEGENFGARNYYTAPDDIGTLINVAGAGIISSSKNHSQAHGLLRFLLGDVSQRYFSENTYEYPLAIGASSYASIPKLDTIGAISIDLSQMKDLEGTLRLLKEVGALD
jgi:iron(III) transport system substrate-binding protein|tara:strand:+ start:269 stop:1327 length:1059 start_codon:yes stop_codon:yes gene_type:complete